MSFTINSMVFKVLLPIMIGVAIMGTLNSIKVTSLDSQVDSVNDVISSIDRTITLGNGGEQQNWLTSESNEENATKARKEFREAVIFNMFAAQHCGFIRRVENVEQENIYSWNDVSEFEETTTSALLYPYPGSPPFELLKENDFSPVCAGASEFQLMPEINFLDNPLIENGNDMEGHFGRINFEVQKNFTLSNPRIAAFEFNEFQDDRQYPDIWRNDRASLMLPDNLKTAEDACNTKQQISFYDSVSNPRDVSRYGSVNVYSKENRGLYAFRLRIDESIPKIKESYDGPQELSLCDSDYSLKSFIKGTGDSEPLKYVMCSSLEGYFQSNAESITNTGAATSDELRSEWIFPQLVAESGAENCIEEAKVSGNDLGLTFGGERCTFEDVIKATEQESEGTTLECGLKPDKISQTDSSGGFKYYNTVWYVDGEAENTCSFENFDVKKTYQNNINPGNIEQTDEFLILRGTSRVKFNLNYQNINNLNSVTVNYKQIREGESMDSPISVSFFKFSDGQTFKNTFQTEGDSEIQTAIDEQLGSVVDPDFENRYFEYYEPPKTLSLEFNFNDNTVVYPNGDSSELTAGPNELFIENQGGEPLYIESVEVSGSTC
ncbi:hypothetical protein GLU60_01110 [Nanohaloarchaea archaeon H01]|nr:hypothetical protein [Nanohaloarchaea archaeon H01]